MHSHLKEFKLKGLYFFIDVLVKSNSVVVILDPICRLVKLNFKISYFHI